MNQSNTQAEKPSTTRRPSHATPKGDDTKTLKTAEVIAAVDLLTEIKQTQKAGLLLLILEHIGTLAVNGAIQEVESTISAVRDQVVSSKGDRDTNLRALRKQTRAALKRTARSE